MHHAWRTHHKDLNALPFPMLADVKRELTSALGVLDALQTDELCPCNWKQGEETLKAA